MPRPTRIPKPPPAVLAQYQQCAHLLRTGRATQALMVLNQLAAARPNDPAVHQLIGSANTELARRVEAVAAFERAVRLAPHDQQMRRQLAFALRRVGEYERALAEYERLLAMTPGSFALARTCAGVLADLGRDEEAAGRLAALRARRDFARQDLNQRLNFALVRARLAPRLVDASEAIDDLRAHVDDPAGDPPIRGAAYAELGRLLEKQGDIDGAFAAFSAGKRVTAVPWDADAHSARIDALIACWRSLRDLPPVDADGSRMVFIVGLMRSGTSLTEQLVAMAPGVTPGGEISAISREVTRLDPLPARHTRPLPLTPARYTPESLAHARAGADGVYAPIAPSGRLTDKQPTNAFYLPLIVRLYPGARIVNCVRDEQDCCLSNFMQAFSRPHPFTNDLESMGRYARDHRRMMLAWRELVGDSVLDLQYESLVADLEGESKRLFAFLGLGWTERVLSFHESERSVATASRRQVRQPIYTSSVRKHEKYAAHLAPLRRGLGLEPS